MAIDSYMTFQQYNGDYLESGSQVDFKNNGESLMENPFKIPTGKGKKGYSQIFEVEDYSFDIEQTLNIGSQTSGAGAGKVTFNPFSITRKIDQASPTLFQMACSGTAFKVVTLALRKGVGTGGGGDSTSGQIFLRFDFKLVAVKTISWSHDDESPKETVTFEYGAMQINYAPQLASGKLTTAIPGGWNRVRNVVWDDKEGLI
jgi:type VI secretion system secreted protein Hcp